MDEDGDIDFDEADSDGDDEENVVFSDEEDDIFSQGGKKKKAKTSHSFDSGTKRGKKNDVTSLFASAEEFSHLLDEGAGKGKPSMAGSEALSNVKDKAGVKQLAWEMNRDRWVRGADWKSKKRPGGGGGGAARRLQHKRGKNKRKR